MELKSRQTSILRKLLKSNEKVTLKELMNSYDIAKRTLYYDIEKINDWLSEEKLGRVVITGQMVDIYISAHNQLEKQLERGENYFFSVKERQTMGIVFIALYHDVVTVQRLEDYFDVSRNTILTDIKEIRRELEQNELSLVTAAKTGYVIQGQESAIRKILGRKIRKLLNSEGKSAIKKLFQESLTTLTQNDIDFFELCNSIIYQYGIDTQRRRILSDVGFESCRVQMALIRNMKGYENNMSDEEKYTLMNTVSYRSVEISAKKLKIHNIIIPDSEVYYITSLLLGIQTVDFLSQDFEDDYIADICTSLIANFERIGCLFFADKEHLQQQLMHHVKPLYYRLKYAIAANNPMVEDIKRMYPIVFDITKKSFQELKFDFAEEISDEELAYICVYMASNLNEKMIEQSVDLAEKGILIIGAENMATAVIVKEQLQELLGITFKYSVESKEKFREWMFEQYILVVVVGDLKQEIKCPHLVKVDPILTEVDQKKIINVLKGNWGISRYDSRINDIISIVNHNTDGNVEKNNLYFELFRYFRAKESKGNRETVADLFEEKIKKENYIFLSENTSWEGAVLTGGSCLQPGEGSLCGRLGNLMARKKLHSYRIQKRVILIHCPMQGDEDGKVDVAIMVSKSGVECPNGEKANILVCLSTVDNYMHWGIMQKIYRYFEVEERVQGILKDCEERKVSDNR